MVKLVGLPVAALCNQWNKNEKIHLCIQFVTALYSDSRPVPAVLGLWKTVQTLAAANLPSVAHVGLLSYLALDRRLVFSLGFACWQPVDESFQEVHALSEILNNSTHANKVHHIHNKLYKNEKDFIKIVALTTPQSTSFLFTKDSVMHGQTNTSCNAPSTTYLCINNVTMVTPFFECILRLEN